MSLEELLLRLLQRMEAIGRENEELFDSEVREQMGLALMDGLVRLQSGFRVPNGFGLATDAANDAVRQAIEEYIEAANAEAESQGVSRFHDRLAAFQDPGVRTQATKSDYDEFFGHTPPEFYDENGAVLRTQ